jgi:hypothetical protein
MAELETSCCPQQTQTICCETADETECCGPEGCAPCGCAPTADTTGSTVQESSNSNHGLARLQL